jgi:hypothetical protein
MQKYPKVVEKLMISAEEPVATPMADYGVRVRVTRLEQACCVLYVSDQWQR